MSPGQGGEKYLPGQILNLKIRLDHSPVEELQQSKEQDESSSTLPRDSRSIHNSPTTVMGEVPHCPLPLEDSAKVSSRNTTSNLSSGSTRPRLAKMIHPCISKAARKHSPALHRNCPAPLRPLIDTLSFSSALAAGAYVWFFPGLCFCSDTLMNMLKLHLASAQKNTRTMSAKSLPKHPC
jgi:hypothetical protein